MSKHATPLECKRFGGDQCILYGGPDCHKDCTMTRKDITCKGCERDVVTVKASGYCQECEDAIREDVEHGRREDARDE